MKTIVILVLTTLLLIGAVALWGQQSPSTPAELPIGEQHVEQPLPPETAFVGVPEKELSPTVLFSIPIGPHGISYQGVGVPEMEDWGPSSIKVDADGDIWIADAVTNRLVEYSEAGIHLRTVLFAEDVVYGINDFIPTAEGVWILAQSGETSIVGLADFQGSLIERYELPNGSQGFVGTLNSDATGRLIIPISTSYFTLNREKGLIELLQSKRKGFETNAVVYPVTIEHNKKLSTPSAAHFVLKAGDVVRTEVLSGDSSMSYLDSDANSNHFMEATESLGEYIFLFDTTIRRYGRDLRLSGVARFPNERFLHNVRHPLAVTADGRVLGLMTYLNRIDVVELHFSQTLEPLEFEDRVPEDVWTGYEVSLGSSCLSRSKIERNAIAYLINRTYLSTSAISGSCSGRKKPRYLGNSGYYNSVAYDWGGFDSVDMFNHAMTLSSRRAGDTNTSEESCSRGVDCSGFVSRVWERSTKYSTNTLQNISTAISKNQLRMGDILNKAGDHVVLYINSCSVSGSSGYLVYEASVSSNSDKVVRNCRRTGDFSSYQARKYNNVCG